MCTYLPFESWGWRWRSWRRWWRWRWRWWWVLGGEVVLPQLADRPLPLTYPLTRSLWCSFLCFGFSFSASLGMWGMQGDRYVFMFLLIIFYRKFPHTLSLSLPVALCPLFLALPTAAALDFSFSFGFVLCFFFLLLSFSLSDFTSRKIPEILQDFFDNLFE